MTDAVQASDKVTARLQDPAVARDVKTLGDFVHIYCAGHHRDRARHAVQTPAAALGVYGRRVPVACEECEAHLAYGEKRRALCPKAPKPFCAHCDTHCYKPDEREWQRQMMRYSGPRSVLRGHALDAIRHALEARKHRAAQRRAADERKDAR
ncbi:MAG: nitrous oxide-stimulated promoter family protein [Anaerosomatales bacterium]|nr:nitrous oxide-stimulated promoter family protein [Anaerosomatales bacterium]